MRLDPDVPAVDPNSLKKLDQFVTSLLVLFSATIYNGHVFAVPVDGLYRASVPVETQQPANRGDAFANALERVLVKISGDRALIVASGLVSILSEPEQYVSSFSYRDNPQYLTFLEEQRLEEQRLAAEVPTEGAQNLERIVAPPDTTVDSALTPVDSGAAEADILPYRLEVDFSLSAINSQMARFGIPIWGKTRPSSLFWVVSENQGERQLIGAADEELVAPILLAAEQRGLPVFFPAVDLDDITSTDVNDIWGLYPEAVDVAAKRYSPDISILVRYRPAAVVSEQLTGGGLDWVFMLKGEQYSGSVQNDVYIDAWGEVLDDVSKILSSRYAVQQRPDTLPGLLNIEVSGVKSFADYAELQKYLSSLPTVQDSHLRWSSADRVFYELNLKGQRAQFFEYLDLGRRLHRGHAPVLAAPLYEESPHGGTEEIANTAGGPVDTEYLVWTPASAIKDR